MTEYAHSKQELKKLFSEVASLDKAHDIYSILSSGVITTTDNIIIKKGKGSLDYYDVVTDADGILSALIETRTDAVAGQQWDIIPGGDNPQDLDLSEFVDWSFRRLKRFKRDLAEMLGAVRTGFSIGEIIWELVDWKGSLKLAPAKILSRRPERFVFDTDYKLRLKTKEDTWKGKVLPEFKFIHHVFRPRYENPYGISVITSCWWAWWFKHHGFAWWLKAAERGAVMTPVGTYPEHYNKEQIAEFTHSLKLFMGDSYIAKMEGTEVDFPTIKIDPEFSSGLRKACNEEMVYRIMGATQSTSGDEGSRAKAAIHDRRFQERVEADSEAIMATINDQLVKPMILLNFPEPAVMPEWKLIYEPPKDSKTIAEVLEKATAMGIPIAIVDAADLLDIPIANPDTTDVLKAPIKQGPLTNDKAEDDIKDEDEDEDENEIPPGSGKASASVVNSSVRFTTKSASFVLRASKQIGTMGKLADAGTKYGMPIYDNLTHQLRSWLKQFSSLEDAVRSSGQFLLDTSRLEDYLLKTGFFSLLYGFHDLTDEPRVKNLLGLDFKIKNKTWQDYLGPMFKKDKWESVNPEEAIKQFQEHTILTREEFDLLLDHERRQTTTAAGMTQKTLESKLQPALMRAIRDGNSYRDFTKDVGKLCMNKHHAENVFRTNVLGAYNTGHFEAIMDKQLLPFIPAIEFVAIIDDRTTEICNTRNGQIYKTEDLENFDIAPPCHYMCRSSVTEVFADEWNGKSSGPPEVPALEGFGKFKKIRG